ncbi:MAG: hypothetical protein ACOYN4_11420, partial [Bacteroidales bacterium]
ANPFVLAAAAIAGVITYLVLFKEKTDDITQAQREFKETSEKSTAEVTALFDQLKHTNAGTEERKKIIEQLNGKYGEYIRNMNLESASLLDIEKAQKAVSNAMLERMATEGKTKDLTDITERKLATLKTIQTKSTKSEYAEILSYIEEGSKAATYTFDQATGKLKSNTVFKSWGKDIDNLMLSLEAIKQQEKAVNETWDSLLSTMQQPINASVTANKTGTTAVDKKQGNSELTQAQKDETARFNARVILNKSALDKMAADEAKFQQDITALGKLASLANIGNGEKRLQAQSEVLAATRTIQEKLLTIEVEYKAKREALQTANPENLTEKLAILETQKQQAIDYVKDEAYQKTEIYKKLSEDIIGYGRKELNVRLASIKKQLEVEGLSANTRADLYKKLSEAQAALDQKSADGLDIASGMLDAMVKTAQAYNKELADSIEKASELLNIVKQAASGNYVGAIISLASMVADIIGGMKQSTEEEKNKRIQDESNKLNNVLDSLADALQWQETLLARAFGTDKIIAFSNATRQAAIGMNKAAETLNFYAGAINKWVDEGLVGANESATAMYEAMRLPTVSIINTNSSAADINKAMKENDEAIKRLAAWNAEMEKTGKLGPEDFDKAMAEYQQYYDELLRLQKEKQQYLTGTTSENLIQDMADAFESGKTSAADFADSFEQLMKNALMESFKLKTLEGPLKAWFEKYTEQLAQGAGNSYEWQQQMALEYERLGAEAKAAWDAMVAANPSLFGGSLSPGSEATLTGAVKGVSEETASIIGGQMNAIRMNQAEQLDLVRNSLMHLANIDNSTYNLHSMKRTLEKVERNTSGSGSTNTNNSIL